MKMPTKDDVVGVICMLGAAAFLWLAIGSAFAADFKTEASDTVIKLISEEYDSSCSAVVISPGVLLSVKHCLLEAGIDTVVGRDGVLFPITGGKISQDTDGWLIYAPGVPCPCATEDTALPAVDETMRMIGFPRGVFNDKREGKVVLVGFPVDLNPIWSRDAVPEEFWHIYIFADIVSIPGDSGGGVFALRGDTWVLIGIQSVEAYDPDAYPYQIPLVSGQVPVGEIER